MATNKTKLLETETFLLKTLIGRNNIFIANEVYLLSIEYKNNEGLVKDDDQVKEQFLVPETFFRGKKIVGKKKKIILKEVCFLC